MKKATIIVLSAICLLSLVCVFTACSTNKIGTPTNIVFDEDNNMTWDEIDGAKGYEIEITETASSEVQSFTPRKPTFSLSDLDEGDYDIRIKALPASRANEASDWSATIFFHKKYETGCVYSLINNGREFEITRVGKAKGKFTIEDEYRGKPVTKIADGAFKKSKAITDVTIGKNVVYVGATAFNACYNLVNVTMSDGVTEIGESCFLSCFALETVNIPKSVSAISPYTFQLCRALKNVDIPDSVVSIGESAFYDCESLEEIVIPDSVTEIGESAFEDCSSLKKVTIGSGLQIIRNKVFGNCSLSEGIDFQTRGNLNYILTQAFYGCTGLSSVTLPDGLTYLGSNAFLNCTNLETLNIPDSVDYVGASVVYKTKIQPAQESLTGNRLFYAGKWLVGISNDLKHSVTKVGGTDGLQLNEGTIGIADSLFRQARELREVVLPDSVKYVCSAAFYKCPKLYSFDAYESDLLLLDAAVFYECELLQQVRVGQKLRSIGQYCFYKCTSLSMPTDYSYIVPDSIREIGKYAFFNSGIWKADGQGVVYAGNWVVGSLSTIGIVSSSVVSLNDGVIGIADYAFAGNQIQAVDNTLSVRYLGEGAFYGCGKLMKYSLSSKIKGIDSFTFDGCQSLSDLGNEDPVDLEYVGRSAFYACTSLKSIDFSQCMKLDKIGIMAFGYSGLEEVVLPEYNDNLNVIAHYAFYECDALKKFVVPHTVQMIGDQAFFGCDALEEISFSGDENEESLLLYINDSAFYRCTSLKAVDIPDSVVSVAGSAFYGCSAVETLTLSANLKTIGNNAFANLTLLKELVLPASLTKIGSYAFSGLESVESVVLPSNVTELGAYAFFQCDYATVYTEFTEEPEDWHARWNPSYRPVVYGVTLSEDKSYVVSVTKTSTTVDNQNEYNSIKAPVRRGYEFKGWATEEDKSKPVYGALDLVNVPDGTTVYAVWNEKVGESA